MKKIGFFTLLMFLLITSACNRNEVDEVTTTTQDEDPDVIDGFEPEVVNVNANLKGSILDENGNAVSGATITLNEETTTTDAEGFFTFANKTMNSKGTVVVANKNGYFEGSRRFFPEEGGQSYVEIELLTESFDYSFEASTGGTVSSNEGLTLTFPAGAIADADGNLYNGQVNVAVRAIDPNAEESISQMPGHYQGVNLNNEEVGVNLFGISAIELQGAGGEELNIAEGSAATVSINVSPAILNEAPASIPLWSYDTTYGLWEEESTATLQGNRYVGEVSHFSFWGSATLTSSSTPLVDWTFRLEGRTAPGTDNIFYLADHFVLFIRDNGGLLFGATNGDGEVSITLPEGETNLNVKVYNHHCGSLIFDNTVDLSPYSSPATQKVRLATYSIFPGPGVGQANTTGMKGQLVDENGNPIANGLVKAEFSGNAIYHYTDADGYFERGFVVCDATTPVTFTATDLSNGNSLTLDISARHKVVMGRLTVDSDPSDFEYIRIKDGFSGSSGGEQFYTNITTFNDDPFITPKEVIASAIDVDGTTMGIIQVGMGGTSGTQDLYLYYHNQSEHNWSPMSLHDGGSVIIDSYGSNLGDEVSGSFNGNGMTSGRSTTGSFRFFNPNP